MARDDSLRPMTIGRRAIREKRIEEQLVEAVRAAGGFCLKLDPHGARGVPDRIVIAPGGRAMAVELKRPSGGRLSPAQKRWRDDLADRGVNWLLVRDRAGVESVALWVRASADDIRRAERGEGQGHGTTGIPGGGH